MATILLGSRALRLRLFPKRKAKAPRPQRKAETLALFDPPDPRDAQDRPSEKLAEKIAALSLLDRATAEILRRAPLLGLRDWWLTAPSIIQPVWNLRSGKAVGHGVLEHEVVYFSEDMSEEAERDVIATAKDLFNGIGTVRVRNQARTHLWYPETFGVAYPPLTTAGEGLLREPIAAATVGMKCTGEDFFDIYAPLGLGDVADMIARPNRALPLSHVYAQVTERWQVRWPRLVIYPWVDDQELNRHKK